MLFPIYKLTYSRFDWICLRIKVFVSEDELFPQLFEKICDNKAFLETKWQSYKRTEYTFAQ